MYNVELLLLMLFATATNTLPQPCDNSHCNYEGVCELHDHNEIRCSCIGAQYFTGPRCTELVDNCALQGGNPCKNGASCVNVLGSYICAPCPPQYAGSDCGYEQADTFTKFYIHHNRLAHYGEQQTFLLTVESLGSALFHVEVFTSKCLIDIFTTFDANKPNNVQWTKSSDLRHVAKSLGLLHTNQMPYTSGYYRVATGTFWVPGPTKIKAIVSNKDITGSVEKQEYIVVVLFPRHVNCVPQMDFPLCSHPKMMLDLDSARFNNFEATVVNRCHKRSQLTYHWRIFSVIGDDEIYDFGISNKRVLKVPPYYFWTDKPLDKSDMFTLQIEAKENGIVTVARCYIYVISKPVMAYILGGKSREVNVGETFTIDGSSSRDYMQPPRMLQNLDFRWNCMSDSDPKNAFCQPFISISKSLRIPAYTLKAKHTYTFTLVVNSRLNTDHTNEQIQIVKTFADRYPLFIVINCVRNCRQNRFNANRFVHLEAICMNNYIHSNMNYVWKTGEDVLGSSRRLIYVPTDVETLDIKVIGTSNGRYGTAEIQLSKNSMPSGGSCTIQPETGEEYITEFKIKCSAFDDTDGDYPLTYEYITNNFTLERTTDHALRLRLPKTTSVKIHICDSFNGCTTTEVTVTVTAMIVPETVQLLREFFVKRENNLQETMANDKSEYAMLLLYILSRNVKSLEPARFIWNQIDQLDLDSLLSVKQMMYISRSFITQLHPLDHKRAKFIGNVLESLNDGLKNVLIDGEVYELSSDNYVDLTNRFAQTLFDFGVQLDQISRTDQKIISSAGSPNDILGEAYSDMQLFDITILTRINDWLHLFKELNRGLHLFGVLQAHMQQPAEPSLDVNIGKDLKLQAFSIDDTTDQKIAMGNGTVVVNMRPELLDALQLDLESTSLLLQTLMLHSNPFWWYPDDTKLSTKVFFFSVFTPTSDDFSYLPLKEPITFSIQIENYTEPPIINGTIESESQMSLYTIKLTGNSLLLVKFESSKASLRIELSLNSKPQVNFVSRSNQIIAANKSATFAILNERNERSKAYIAIMSNEHKLYPVPYAFRSEIRQCLYFEFKLNDPQWTNLGGCWPNPIGHTTYNISCNCHHMSAFAGKILPSLPRMSKPVEHLVYLTFNWEMIVLCSLFIIAMFLIYGKAYKDAQVYNKILYLAQCDEDATKKYDVKIRIVTGIQPNAGTTANVIITFLTLDGPPKQFTIYQNPKKHRLKSNTTCSICLPLNSNELVTPVKMSISHNNAGLYPTWYCRYIEIYDLKWKHTYCIEVDSWIRSRQKVKPVVDTTRKRFFASSKIMVFKIAFTSVFAQWFLWQPIYGIWENMDTYESYTTRYDRTCIWLVKFWITVCIVFCYFGQTTLENYEEERDIYYRLGIPILKLIILSLVCYSIALVLRITLMFLIKRKEK